MSKYWYICEHKTYGPFEKITEALMDFVTTNKTKGDLYFGKSQDNLTKIDNIAEARSVYDGETPCTHCHRD